MIQQVTKNIQQAQSILLTTHRQCDGDGLGSELAMFHGLKKMGKNVRILNVDTTPKKYGFLSPEKYIQCYDSDFDPILELDMVLIFDTNDRRLIEPLYTELEKKCSQIIFVDHHPILKEGPSPTAHSLIDVSAASTGEMTFDLIKSLEIPLDPTMARALYTSLAFDTQLFRYIKNSPRSHEVAVELLKFEKNPAEIHRRLFGNFNVKKLKFIADCMKKVEFFENERLAILYIRTKELESMGLDANDSLDLIDLIMGVESIQAAAVVREDKNTFKMSMRSKGAFPILSIAEAFGGGGHPFASGASIEGSYQDLKEQILEAMKTKLNETEKKNTQPG